MIGEVVEVEITALAPGGDAVGRQVGGEHAGRATFVPLAAPGELVRAQVVRQRSRVAWAELIEVVRPSPERVEPRCPLFGRCGGCQWQHVTRDRQLAEKRAIVARAVGVPVDEVRAVAVGPAYGYRDRARLTRGSTGIGFVARRSHDVVDVPACPLVGEALASAWPALRSIANTIAPGEQVAAQAGHGAVVALARGRSFRVVDGEARAQAGEALVDVGEPEGPPLPIPAGAFAQVGAAANAALVAEVMAQVGPHPGATLELYAGSGNFTRHLVGRAAAVTAADGDARAVTRGRANVPGARWLTHAELAQARGPFDLVLVDPPRDGLGAPEARAAASSRNAVVYVSCDPQTLGRDLRALRAAGFEVSSVAALDLMPQTSHVEVVVTLRRP